MKKYLILFAVSFLMMMNSGSSQELFSYTEPASNMAANSIGVRLTDHLMNSDSGSTFRQIVVPEMMWGISKNIMLHIDVYASDMNNKFEFSGGSMYLKYRFYSNDDIHSHFRMAAFGKYSMNNVKMIQSVIDLNGIHSGFEMGLIGTQLIHKIAISSSVSWVHASDVFDDNKFMTMNSNVRDAFNYSVSIGKLMLPKEYVSYNQTNMNIMIEALGQANVSSGAANLDITPVLQFIIKSKMRIDLGYRLPVVNNIFRSFSEGGMIRFEYNFFNVIK